MTVGKYYDELTDEEKQQNVSAGLLYNQYYENYLFAAAIRGRDTIYANQLIDQALSVCGSPHYRVRSREEWDDQANAFLDVFRKAVKARR